MESKWKSSAGDTQGTEGNTPPKNFSALPVIRWRERSPPWATTAIVFTWCCRMTTLTHCSCSIAPRVRLLLLMIRLTHPWDGAIITGNHTGHSLPALWWHVTPRTPHLVQIDLNVRKKTDQNEKRLALKTVEPRSEVLYFGLLGPRSESYCEIPI